MKLVVCNQKAYLESNEVNRFIEGIKDYNLTNIIICPSIIYIDRFKTLNIPLGSQLVSIHNNGSYTGEITAKQLKNIEVTYAIVGHSEHKDTKENIIKRINLLTLEDIIPILCIGETLEDKNNNLSKEVIYKKITEILDEIKEIKDLIIAYEPIYSIGTNIVPANEEIIEVVTYIKDIINKRYNKKVKVLYGGSVNRESINNLNKIEILDGYLVGKASTNYLELKEIIKKA